jgi:hypothetical protein
MIVNNIAKYDGKILHDRFAYTFFRKKVLPSGNIIAFVCPMEVEGEGMIDKEDILDGDFIYSDLAINFLWEIPNLEPFGAVCFQRLFNTQIAHILSTNYLKCPILMKGDDIMVQKEHTNQGIVQPNGKCSVSITHVKNHAALGHTGINIHAGKKAPAFAYSTNLNIEQSESFMKEVMDTFYHLTDDIFVATSKVIA